MNRTQPTCDSVGPMSFARGTCTLAASSSWGSILGVHMITQRPDLFAAYVGTGQVINLRKQLEAGYPALRARAATNEKADSELKTIGPPPWVNDDAYRIVNRWANALDPPSKVDLHVCEMERREAPPTYIQAGAQFSGRLLSEVIGREDLQRWATHFEVPVFFIQGREDVLTTTSVVAAYVDEIEAPTKALIELPGTGHLAIFRDPDAFLAALESRVRPLALDHPRAR
jgi:pimeloyl-ACP methyl ester carboxylesterase